MKLRACLVGVCAGAGLSGCTFIQLDGAQRVTEARFGVLRIEPAQGTQMIAMESTGFGLIPTIYGGSAGYRSDRVAILPEGTTCQVVVFRWPENPEAANRVRALLENDQGLCALTQGDSQ